MVKVKAHQRKIYIVRHFGFDAEDQIRGIVKAKNETEARRKAKKRLDDKIAKPFLCSRKPVRLQVQLPL